MKVRKCGIFTQLFSGHGDECEMTQAMADAFTEKIAAVLRNSEIVSGINGELEGIS